MIDILLATVGERPQRVDEIVARLRRDGVSANYGTVYGALLECSYRGWLRPDGLKWRAF